jgi:hypothetical protein
VAVVGGAGGASLEEFKRAISLLKDAMAADQVLSSTPAPERHKLGQQLG